MSEKIVSLDDYITNLSMVASLGRITGKNDFANTIEAVLTSLKLVAEHEKDVHEEALMEQYDEGYSDGFTAADRGAGE